MSAVPSWKELEKVIPVEFTDNGFSTPWPLRLFRGPISILATRYAPIESRGGRVHDWLFWFGRLPGAPLGTERLTMYQANEVLENMLTWFEYPRTARVVRVTLDRCGGGSWRKAGKAMWRRGLRTYDDYLQELAARYGRAV